MKNDFAKKVRRNEKTVLYELLPPPKNLPRSDLSQSIKLFSKMLSKYPVDAVNLPEVREETRSGSRNESELIKLEPTVVASYLQRYKTPGIIINRPIVYETWEKQERWLRKAYSLGIHNFVFVGGESSKFSYPGPSVIDAAKTVASKLNHEFPSIFLGGITIPNRKNEPTRILNKALAGIEFFTTQILYESESIKSLLNDYWGLCKAKNIRPKMIFLTFAPVTSYRDIELLTWLGVEIGQKTLKTLKIGWLGMGERSFKISEDILKDILSFVEREDIKVPLGLNVEHVKRHNFELSFVLLARLLNIYSPQKKVSSKYYD
ncbi:MAG: hypothetical protein M1405_02630 [Patescibacteria group bacterium]|nr:hypothetical protein [Patescibacteria group bacterium]